VKKTNPNLINLIQQLHQTSKEQEVNIWKDIAQRLEKPKKNYPQVNLDKIQKHLLDKETALIPGKVLGNGEIKKMDIAAWEFSQTAKNKIKKAGGKCYSIQELIQKNPKGKNIRIIGG
jgi:large subunit ribosomal protein L18e